MNGGAGGSAFAGLVNHFLKRPSNDSSMKWKFIETKVVTFSFVSGLACLIGL